MARVVRIGMLKAVPKKWDKEANWETMERLVRDAARFNIDVAVTPECFLDGYVVGEKDWTRERFMAVAEPGEGGAYVGMIGNLADELGIYIVAGFTEIRRDDFLNAAYLFGRDGKIEGKYYKIHVHERYSPGSSLPIFDADFGRIGILICADRRWPENARSLVLQGAEVILMPTYGMWHEANEAWMRTRSYENGVYICFTHPQLALITDPEGNVAAKLASNIEDILIHDLDLNLVKRNHLEKRRPELYGILCKK